QRKQEKNKKCFVHDQLLCNQFQLVLGMYGEDAEFPGNPHNRLPLTLLLKTKFAPARRAA
ncbi:MAG: hypothetical protein AAGA62_13440, partial [Bacteroidota bacterium]